MVPIGTRPRSRASSTLEVPFEVLGIWCLKVSTTSRCQSNEKRRRRPKSKHLERVAGGASSLEAAQLLDLAEQPALASARAAFSSKRREVQLVDDRQRGRSRSHHMHLRAVDDDLQVAADGARADEVALEAEDAQEVDEVVLDETEAGQVLQLVGAEAQRAQVVELAVDVVDQLGQRKLADLAAEKGVLGLRLRENDAASSATS